MKDETVTHLRAARSLLGECAKKASGKTATSTQDREMVIGFGTARDWVRWAGGLASIEFAQRSEARSARKEGILESIRFNQLWTAANALFAKDSILRLTMSSKLPVSEAARFAALYAFARLDPAIGDRSVTVLNDLLGMECDAAGIITTRPGKSTPSMWEVIDQKYSRSEDRRRGIGKVISTALDAGSIPSPNGPTLIYGARNWAIHGMLLTSFFRGSRQKYVTFIDNLTLLLAAVLAGAAREFHDSF